MWATLPNCGELSKFLKGNNYLKTTHILIEMDKEFEWKKLPVEGTDDYFVSEDGQIFSSKYNKSLSPCLRAGYLSIYIYKIKKNLKVHQMVAKAFIPNNDPTKQIVNHIDGNKLNNHVSNLEWVSLLQNNKHAIDSGLTKITRRRVYQCDLDGNIIKIHDTIRGAGKDTNVDSGAIAKVCKGTRNKAGGFKWRFVDQNPNENDIDLSDFIQVVDFPNYLINKNGDVYSKPYKKLLKQQKNNDGYMGIQLTNKGNRRSYLVHRLVAIHFIDKRINDGNKINHKDGDKTNNHVENLEWVTDSENLKHYYSLNKKNKT